MTGRQQMMLLNVQKSICFKRNRSVFSIVAVLTAGLTFIVFYPRLLARTRVHKGVGNKMIIYSCTSEGCGGWADRQKGIVGAYVLAVLLNRDFRIKLTFPCDLNLFFSRNKLEWRLTREEEAAIYSGTSVKFIDTEGMETFKDEFLSKDDLELQFPDWVTVMTWNMEAVQYLRNHSIGRRLRWLQQLSVPQIYRKVLTELFTLKPSLKRELENLKGRVPQNSSLVCVQVRLGNSAEFPDSLEFHKLEEFYPVFANFLKRYSDVAKYRILITADNAEVISRAQQQYPEVVLPPMPGTITHTDKAYGSEACSGLRKAILDQHALSTCDVLVISDSGLGKIASFLRGHDNDLYLVPQAGATDFIAVKRSLKFRVDW